MAVLRVRKAARVAGRDVQTVVVRGPAGPPGAGGGAADSYTHNQSSASATWTINHNLGRLPIVTLLTPGLVEFEAELVHTSNNQCIAYLATPLAGQARCI